MTRTFGVRMGGRAVGAKSRDGASMRVVKLIGLCAMQLTRVPAEASIKRLRNHAHKLPITCLALSHNERYLYTASKDCRIIKCT
jgi:hypothetical protein